MFPKYRNMYILGSLVKKMDVNEEFLLEYKIMQARKKTGGIVADKRIKFRKIYDCCSILLLTLVLSNIPIVQHIGI